MYFVVCSDNHTNYEILTEIRKKHPDAMAYIHCGDSELPIDMMDGFITVRGNCDYYPEYEDKQIVNINGELNILVIHSHRQNINRIYQLAEMAKEYNCQLVCYGHTHRFDVKKVDGITLVNPGSLRYNRDMTPTCYALVYYENGKFRVQRINTAEY